ncbi:MAG: SusD/RagB family nutrient-binding outer membrane lipoprotein, partial [Sphingobacteriaceae bacterium]
MKKYIKPIVLMLTLPGLMLSSCKKFGDTNIDPTRSSDLDPALQLSYAQVRYSGDLEVNEKLSVVMTMPLVQQIGGIWANRYGQFYIKSTPYLYSLWEYTYGLDVMNLVDAVTRTTGDASRSNLNAVCRIMKVYEFARLTDIYGDIPYSEAGKAFSDGIIRPKFDTQEAIYDDFFKELKEAGEQLDASKDPVKGDFFYNGDIAKWKKFANSLRLRYAMRLVKRNPAKAQAEAQAAVNAGVFTSNDDICALNHENVQNNYADIRGNGLSSAFAQAEVIPRLTNTFIGQLNNTNDPRLKYLVKYYIDIVNRPFERTDITAPVVAQIGYNGVNPKSYVWDDWMNPISIEVGGKTLTAVNNDQKAQLANFMIAL